MSEGEEPSNKSELPLPTSDALPKSKRRWPARLNELGSNLKRLWRKQHFLHVLFSFGGLLIAGISLFITIHGFYVYVREGPDRAVQNRLLKLQTVNSAWETIRETRGAQSERGQTFALNTLVNSGIDLSGLDLSGTTINAVDLKKANLESANLSNATLHRVDLDYAALGLAIADDAIFDRASMDYDTGIPRSMVRAFLIDMTASNSPQLGISVSGTVNFDTAVIIHADLNLWLTPTNFHDACLVGVEFVDHHLKHAGEPALRLSDFTSSRIYGGTFQGADLSGADFRGAEFLPPRRYSEANDKIVQVFVDMNFGRGSGKTIDDLFRSGLIPKCLAFNKHVSAISNITSEVVGDAVTPKGDAGYEDQDAVLWLGGGRLTTDFSRANLLSTRLEGVDLRNTTGLTQAQIDVACLDDRTVLPNNLSSSSRRCLKVIRSAQGFVTATLVRNISGPGKPDTCAWENRVVGVVSRIDPVSCVDTKVPPDIASLFDLTP